MAQGSIVSSLGFATNWLKHTAAEEFENRFLTQNTFPNVSQFKNSTIARHIGFLFEENTGREITLSWLNSKRFVFKLFSVHTKRKSRHFQNPPIWKAFLNSSVGCFWIATADRLAQLVERRTTVREVSGSNPRPDQRTNTQGLKITEENMLPLQWPLQMVRYSSLLG